MGSRRGAPWITGIAALAVGSCSSAPAGSDAAEELAERQLDAVIAVSSPAFGEGEPIPVEFSCDGEEVSPPLSWDGVPSDAVELVLVVDDPDAPGGTYVHWVLFGLDPSLTELDAGVVPANGRQAKNSAGDAAYKGPCPPGGHLHHYRFSVYALGEEAAADDAAPGGEVLGLVSEAAIAKGTLTGTFER